MRIEILQSPESIDQIVQQVERSAGRITRTAVTLGLELFDSLVENIASSVESRMSLSSAEESDSFPGRPFLSVREAADFLRIRPSTVYLWVSENKVPHSKIGSRLLFKREELEQFVQASTHTEKASEIHSQSKIGVVK